MSTPDDIEALRQMRPRHILFLCVQNSARSQMAEGIARHLAPPGVKISSAGSQPAFVRPQAVQALAEIGIDISGQSSKAVADLDTSTVDAVITLCAEEVCPVFARPVAKFHWGLPDPAQAMGDKQQAFAEVRNELKQRLEKLFSRP
ncbi:MAG: arsenate reductase ArsC [Planctomycetes bacterium]|nr:arsenate reductase ArsC [Planctomycetota bacterium]